MWEFPILELFHQSHAYSLQSATAKSSPELWLVGFCRALFCARTNEEQVFGIFLQLGLSRPVLLQDLETALTGKFDLVQSAASVSRSASN